MTMQTVQWRGQLRTGDQAYCRGHIVTLVERVPPDDWKVTGGNLPGVWSAQAHELTPIPGKPYAAHDGRDPRLCYPDGKPVKVGDLVRVTVTGHRAGQTPCEVEKLHEFGQIRLRQGKSTWSLSGSMLEFVGRKSEGELPPVDDGAQPMPDVDADLVPVTEFRTVKAPVMDDTFARSRANHAAKAPMWELKTPPREVTVEEMQAAEAALAEAKAKREAAAVQVSAPSNEEVLGARDRVLEEQAFDAKAIMQAVLGALVSRAVVEYRIITTAGPITIRRAGDLRWNEDEGRPEVYVADAWVLVPDTGIITMAAEEHLHWRRPDGTVLRWDAEADPYTEPEPEHVEKFV